MTRADARPASLSRLSLQCPRGGVSEESGHRLLRVGLLAEPGGSAGNHVDLHVPGLRTAAPNQPLEMINICICIHQPCALSIYLTRLK